MSCVIVKVLIAIRLVLRAFLKYLTEDVLFSFLKSFDFGNGLPLSKSLCLLHLRVTEANLLGLLSLLRLGGHLECRKVLLDIWVSVAKHFLILLETIITSDDCIILKRFTAVLE